MDVNDYLDLIEACQKIIARLEIKAVQYPHLADEIGLAIKDNRDIINMYREEILKCIT